VGPGDGLSALAGLHTLAVRVKRTRRVPTRGAPCERRGAMSDPFSRTVLLYPVLLCRVGIATGFDLRLPHVEVGYEDPDADIMGKIGRFFGFGKKPQEKKPEGKE